MKCNRLRNICILPFIFLVGACIPGSLTDTEQSPKHIHIMGVSVEGERLSKVRLDYGAFTLWVDCDNRRAYRFHYIADKDVGSLDRSSRFGFEPSLPSYCRQTSQDTYKADGHYYDRGHLVPANHLDHDMDAIKSSNNMVNILPQQRTMNRGAWYHTEKIVECQRDTAPVIVMGGPIYNEQQVSKNRDLFIESHGVAVPDAFWKVIIQGDKVIGWIIPNSADAKGSRLSQYEIRDIDAVQSIANIKLKEGMRLDATLSATPDNCDLG